MRLDSSGVTVLRELHENYGPSWTYLFIEPLENLRLLGRRAVLALLGIAVGCMAVVALLNIGHNARVQAMSVFKGMGIAVESIREWLHKYRQWAVASGLAESMQQKYQRHLLKMARLGINIDRHHSLKNRLRQIKRWVVSPELRDEKARTEADIGAVLDEQARKVRQLRPKNSTANHTLSTASFGRAKKEVAPGQAGA